MLRGSGLQVVVASGVIFFIEHSLHVYKGEDYEERHDFVTALTEEGN